MESSTEKLLLRNLNTVGVVKKDFNFNEELLAEAVAFGALEAKVDLSDLEASCHALVLKGLELWSDLDGDV